MPNADQVFAGSIPENYDRHMVPLIFEPYAVDLARRIVSLSPGAVLEIAAGTGAVTRALAPQLSPDARYVVTDLNQPMLDYAASRQGPDSRVTWLQADALRCLSRMPPSISFAVNSGRCSSQTASRPIARQNAC